MNQASNDLPPKSLTEIASFAEKRFNEICPQGMTFGAEVSFAFQILQDKPDLMTVAKGCPRSLVSVLQNLAAIGLSLNPAKKEAYLLSRNIKTTVDGKEVWESRLFLEPSYIGLNKVATDTGAIEWVQARVVRKADECIDNGVGLRPTHTYDVFATNEARGEIVGAYCVAKLPSGDFLTKFINKERLDDIRGRSETWKKYQKGTWLTDQEEMIMKATMRTSFKTWPKTGSHHFERLEQAVHLSDQNEGFEPIVTSPEIRNFTGDQKSMLDQLITNNDSIGMYCFMTSLPEGVQTSLRHSFPKGEKGKYAKLLDELQASGRAQMVDIRATVEESSQSGDDLAVKELLEDISQEAIDNIKANVTDEVRQFIDMCLQEAA
jgi:recombination protein RecT